MRDVAQQLRGGAAIGAQLIRPSRRNRAPAPRVRPCVPRVPRSRGGRRWREARFSEASARAPSWMRRMGALKCCASHQLVSAVTTSAMQMMASEISGRLNAPKMLGRRGTSSTVKTPPSAPKICGAARPGRRLPLRLTNSSRLKIFQAPRRALGQAPAQDVRPVRTDDVQIAVRHGVLVGVRASA